MSPVTSRILEWAVLCRGPDDVVPMTLIVPAVTAEEACAEMRSAGYVVHGVAREPRRLLRRIVSTMGCAALAAFCVALREVVVRSTGSAGSILGMLFTEVTLAVAGAALVGVLTIWCPHGRVSLAIQRLSEHHLALVGIGSFASVLAGLVSGVLYALGLLP